MPRCIGGRGGQRLGEGKAARRVVRCTPRASARSNRSSWAPTASSQSQSSSLVDSHRLPPSLIVVVALGFRIRVSARVRAHSATRPRARSCAGGGAAFAFAAATCEQGSPRVHRRPSPKRAAWVRPVGPLHDLPPSSSTSLAHCGSPRHPRAGDQIAMGQLSRQRRPFLDGLATAAVADVALQ